MSTFKKVKVRFIHNKFLLTSLVIFLVCVTKYFLISNKVELVTEQGMYSKMTSDNLEPEQLICERVRENVIENRKKEFTSRVNPSHNWIEEFVEIISENITTCQDISTNAKLLVIIVNSKMDHFRERQVIRESYGLIRQHQNENVTWHVRTAFLVAQSSICQPRWINESSWKETKMNEIRLEEEQQKYEDLVIGSFSDTYRNNTYKQLMGFKFVLERCPQADLVVKTDDDVFVNVPAILNQRMGEWKSNKIVNDIYCPWLQKRRAVRRKVNLYFVQEEEWSVDVYPDFCAGAFMVLSVEWMRMLYSVRNMGGFLWIDDTHVSGRLREIAEKEFGVKANILKINKRVWWNGLKDKTICAKRNAKNVQMKWKKLPLFVQFVRNKMMENNMKCLTNILQEYSERN